jgi:phage-related protein
MKKEEIPQDDGALNKLTKEVVYAVDSSGNYITELSTGWEVKATALDVAWKDIEQRIQNARQKVVNNEASPLLYFIELRLMDIGILAAYTGFWKWTIKQHLKPSVFKKLSNKKLQQYADTFNVTVEELKTMNVHED